MKISACVIVKNEEKNIQQWLSCMKDIADEMIVVDTGSGDRTVELAKAGGARVYHFKWRNDFSAAKNYALDRATGDWIFFLDADEYFSESTRKRIRSLLERAHGNHRIIGINSTLYNIDVDRNNEINSTAIQQRIFRRNKHLRYEGRIHEYLVYHGKKTMDFAMSDIVIYHTGYSSGLTRKKNIRNLLLILLDVQAQGSVTEKHYSYLSVTYFNLLQYDKAIHYAKLAIQAKGKGAESTFVKQYWIWIRAEQRKGTSKEEIQKIIDKALIDVPGHPDFMWEKAKLALQRHDYVLAEEQMIKILEQAGDKKRMSQYETTIYGQFPIIYAALGKIYDTQGEKEKAENYYKLALQKDFRKLNVLHDLLNLRSDDDAKETIQLLDEIYAKESEQNFLRKCLEARPRDEIYLYYMHPEKGSYEDLMGRKNYLEAAGIAAKEFSVFLDSGRAQEESEQFEKLGRNLVLALLYLPDEKFKEAFEALSVLPQELKNCILRFHDDNYVLPIENAVTYHAMLDVVLQYGAPEIIDRFGRIAGAFIEQDILEVSVRLFGRGRWQAVLDLYKEISEKTRAVLPGIWYYTGVCLFHQGKRKEAFECLTRAQQMNMQSPDLSVYLAWCEKKGLSS